MSFEAEKDPEAVVDYVINYAVEFAKSDPADQINTSAWACTTALTVGVNSIIANNQAVVWVSGGGIWGSFHKLVNTVTTIGGRTYERTILVEIRNK